MSNSYVKAGFGGLLRGLGTGYAEQKKQEGITLREEKLMRLKAQFDEDQNARKHGYRMNETELAQDRADKRAEADRELTRSGRARDGADTKEVGSKIMAWNEDTQAYDIVVGPAPVGGSSKKTGSLTDNQLLDAARKAATSIDPDSGIEVVDRSKIDQYLQDAGRNDLAKPYGQASGPRGLSRQEAMDRAKAEAEDKAGWLTEDKIDFSEYGGSRERYITERADELQNPGKGDTRKTEEGREVVEKAAQERSASLGQEIGGGDMPKPPQGLEGSGTKAQPFMATQQTHIDWFIANAPDGAVIMVNGKLHTKK